jgi:hypothetical protein
VGVRWVPAVGAVLAVLALTVNVLEHRLNPPFPPHRPAIADALAEASAEA